MRSGCSEERFGEEGPSWKLRFQHQGHHVVDRHPRHQKQFSPAFPTSRVTWSAATSFGSPIDRRGDRRSIAQGMHREQWLSKPVRQAPRLPSVAVSALLPPNLGSISASMPVLRSRRGVQGVVGVLACQPACQSGKKKKKKSSMDGTVLGSGRKTKNPQPVRFDIQSHGLSPASPVRMYCTTS